MPKILRTGATLLTVAVLVCLVGFVHARDVLQVAPPDESAADARYANRAHAGQSSVPATALPLRARSR